MYQLHVSDVDVIMPTGKHHTPAQHNRIMTFRKRPACLLVAFGQACEYRAARMLPLKAFRLSQSSKTPTLRQRVPVNRLTGPPIRMSSTVNRSRFGRLPLSTSGPQKTALTVCASFCPTGTLT